MWLNMQSRTSGEAGRGVRSSEEEEDDEEEAEEEVTAQGEVGGARRAAVSQATVRSLELRSSRGVSPAPSVPEPAH